MNYIQAVIAILMVRDYYSKTKVGFDVQVINEIPKETWKYDHWKFNDGKNKIVVFAPKDTHLTVEGATFIAKHHRVHKLPDTQFTGCSARDCHLIEWGNRKRYNLNDWTVSEFDENGTLIKKEEMK